MGVPHRVALAHVTRYDLAMTMRRRVLASLPVLILAVPAHAQGPEEQPTILLPVEPPPPLVLDLAPYPEFVPFIRVEKPRLAKQVRAMLDAAMQTDDSAAVAAVVKFAQQTQPYDKDEIRDLQRAYLDRRARELAAKTEAELARIRASGPLELWKGQIELGAFRSTGNTDNFGFTAAFNFNRKGIEWEHIVQARADYQEDRGVITREQYSASYQPRYTLNDGFFTYARTQYERDRIQGFEDRYTLSGGLGYRVLNGRTKTLSLEAGPAIRRINYVDEPNQTTWSVLTSIDFDWKINPQLKLTQDASAYVGSDNNTFTSLTALESGLVKGLKAKLSYAIEHETSPPIGSLKTDTISRFSLVYGF
jgi:putative salt-induced outer membrane protein